MTKLDKSVFISYRHDYNPDFVDRIYDWLIWKGFDVFLDTTMSAGSDWKKTLRNEVSKRTILLVIIGSQWESILKQKAFEEDWVRTELELAHQYNVPIIIPVKIKAASLPSSLPPTLNFLKEKQDYLLRDRKEFKNSFEQLIEEINRGLEELSKIKAGQTVIDEHSAIQQLLHGLALRQKGDNKGAIAAYNKAIEINKEYIEAYNNRAVAQRYLRNYGKALEDYNEAIRIYPEYLKAYKNRGELYFIMGEVELALKDFQEAVRLDSTDKGSLSGLAISYYRLGNIAEGIQIWRSLFSSNNLFNDANWVKEELKWDRPLVDEARKLIAEL